MRGRGPAGGHGHGPVGPPLGDQHAAQDERQGQRQVGSHERGRADGHRGGGAETIARGRPPAEEPRGQADPSEGQAALETRRRELPERRDGGHDRRPGGDEHPRRAPRPEQPGRAERGQRQAAAGRRRGRGRPPPTPSASAGRHRRPRGSTPTGCSSAGSTRSPTLNTGPCPSRIMRAMRRLMNPSSVIQRRSQARSTRIRAGSASTAACAHRPTSRRGQPPAGCACRRGVDRRARLEDPLLRQGT